MKGSEISLFSVRKLNFLLDFSFYDQITKIMVIFLFSGVN